MDTVLLTGAASGIGRATAWQLARLGHRCVLVDRNAEALEGLMMQLRAVGEPADHLIRVADLTDPDQILKLADGLPPLDALINNAGMTDASNLPVTEQAEDNWQRVLDLNLRAPARLLHALRDRLTRHARVVNVASGAGLRAIPWRGAYSPSKAGLIAHTRAVARAYPDLRVTVLCPGFVQTELVDALIASGRLDPARAVAKIPLGRLAAPDDIACALTFLASRDAAPLAGGQVCVDGGSSIFGGSQAYTLNAIARLPGDTPLRLTLRGDWPGLTALDGQDGCGAELTNLDARGGNPAGLSSLDARDSHSAVPSTPDARNGYPAPLSDPHAQYDYPAVIDTTVLHSPPGTRLAATLAAARRHTPSGPGSLTLLLPRPATDDYEHAGDDAAARMLIATLACEWGPGAHRINAVEVGSADDGAALYPLLRFVAGAEAQYLTGQTLCTR